MMRSIHPLYLLGLIFLVLLVLMWKSSSLEDELILETNERSSAKTMAKRIIDLKKVMQSPDLAKMDKFLDNSRFNESGMTHIRKNSLYLVKANSLNSRQLQTLLNRILNLNVKIKTLKIEKKNDKDVRFYLEIKI